MKVPSLPDRTTGDINNTYFDKQWNYLTAALNGGLDFGSPSSGSDNFNGSWWSGTTPAADTDFNVPITIKRAPTGYLVFSIDKPGIVYKGSGKWTTSSITLRCNIASANVVLLVI